MSSKAAVKQARSEVRGHRAAFLVASLCRPSAANDKAAHRAASAAGAPSNPHTAMLALEAALEVDDPSALTALMAEHAKPVYFSNDLFDSRAALVGAMRGWHWQWDELRRAHYSTMMMLAHMGGAPP